ncbi:hypothetical protein [Rhodococcus sp. MTM3W5.2]|nr:hypothetical protein [Rhodococcus sp. MTM3W5.2]
MPRILGRPDDGDLAGQFGDADPAACHSPTATSTAGLDLLAVPGEQLGN